MSGRPLLLVVGGTPPPVHGTTVFMRMLLDAPEVKERFEVLHLETADRRGLENIGRLDLTNAGLALRHVAGLIRLVARRRPDLVYLSVSQNALAYLRDGLFILIAAAAGSRVVTHLHGGGFGEFYRRANPAVRWWVRLTQRRVHRAWVLGEGLRGCYDGLVAQSRVRVAPNGVPDPRPPDGQLPPVESDRPDVLFLGQLSAPKGVLDVLEAAKLLGRTHPPFRLVLAGAWASEEERREAERLLSAGGLADRVELSGVLTGEAKALAFARARVFVLPTWYPPEGQPLSILEAMAAGLPVIATPRAAIPDMVLDGETGLLVPERDPESLARALGGRLGDPEMARRLGAAGRRRYLERFTVERCMGRVAELLLEALPERRGVASSLPELA